MLENQVGRIFLNFFCLNDGHVEGMVLGLRHHLL